MKSSVPSVAWPEQSASLPGRRSLRVAEARWTSLSLRRFSRSSARSRTKASRAPAVLGWSLSQWSNGSRSEASTRRWASIDDSRSLVCPWNSGIAHEDADQGAGLGDDVIGGDQVAALLAGEFGPVAQAPRQHGAQAGLVRAALRRRHGVAVGAHEAVGLAETGGGPGDGPLHRPGLALALDAAGEGLRGDRLRVLQRLGEVVGEAAREVEGRLGGRFVG